MKARGRWVVACSREGCPALVIRLLAS